MEGEVECLWKYCFTPGTHKTIRQFIPCEFTWLRAVFICPACWACSASINITKSLIRPRYENMFICTGCPRSRSIEGTFQSSVTGFSSKAHTLFHSLIYSPILLRTYYFTRSLTHLFTHSLTSSLLCALPTVTCSTTLLNAITHKLSQTKYSWPLTLE